MPIESSVIDGNEWRSEKQCPVSKKQSSVPFSRSQRNGPLSRRTPATDSKLGKICPIVGEGQTLFTTVSRRQHSSRRPRWALLLWLPWMTTTDYINFHPIWSCVGFFFFIYWPIYMWLCDFNQWGVPDCCTQDQLALLCKRKFRKIWDPNPPSARGYTDCLSLNQLYILLVSKAWTKWTNGHLVQLLPTCLKLTFMSVLFVSWQHQVMFTVVTIRQTDCLACLFDMSTQA